VQPDKKQDEHSGEDALEIQDGVEGGEENEGEGDDDKEEVEEDEGEGGLFV